MRAVFIIEARISRIEPRNAVTSLTSIEFDVAWAVSILAVYPVVETKSQWWHGYLRTAFMAVIEIAVLVPAIVAVLVDVVAFHYVPISATDWSSQKSVRILIRSLTVFASLTK